MKVQLQRVLPNEIEKRSMEIISEEIGTIYIEKKNEAVIKRVIHTTADFDYINNLCFSDDAVKKGIAALKSGAVIITDTQMALSGVNKKALGQLGSTTVCYMSDDDVYAAAKQNGTTRATASIDKAVKLGDNVIYAIGNAPTALVRLYELISEETIKPKLIIGVPVGFVNVVESKELILQTDIPYIVAKGRKGGSNVAAAICNALLYEAAGRTI